MGGCQTHEELLLHWGVGVGEAEKWIQTGVGGNVDNSYWLIRCFSGVGAWIRRRWNISGLAAGSC